MRICASATTLAVDLGDTVEPPEVSAPLDELDAQHELIARPHRLLEARLLDTDEIENPDAFFRRSGFVREHSARLGQRFDDQHARHHGVAGEVPLEVRLVRADVLHGDDRLARHDVEHTVDHQERIAMRQALEDPIDVERL